MNNFSSAQNITVNYSDNNLNQLTQRGVNAGTEKDTRTWDYDANGNMILEQKGQTPIREFNYNFDDRMVTVSNPGGVLEDIEYDALGRWLIHTDGITGQQTLYYYDGIRVILEKQKNGQNWQTSKIYTLQDGAIGFIIAETPLNPVGLTMWYHYDRLGNVMDLTDEDGSISASYDQDAFGNVLSGNQSGYHLTTKEFPPPISLYYFFQCWYDSCLRIFLCSSPKPRYIEHPYISSFQNPMSCIDLTGEFAAALYCAAEAAARGPWGPSDGCRSFADQNCEGPNSPIQQCLDRLGWLAWGCTVIHYKGLLHDACLISCPLISCTVEKPGIFPPIVRCMPGPIPPPPLLP